MDFIFGGKKKKEKLLDKGELNDIFCLYPTYWYSENGEFPGGRGQ